MVRFFGVINMYVYEEENMLWETVEECLVWRTSEWMLSVCRTFSPSHCVTVRPRLHSIPLVHTTSYLSSLLDLFNVLHSKLALDKFLPPVTKIYSVCKNKFRLSTFYHCRLFSEHQIKMLCYVCICSNVFVTLIFNLTPTFLPEELYLRNIT